MKKLLLSFFAFVALSASLMAEEPIKILGIGNSFTMDAMEQHLNPIMVSLSKPCILGYPYNGGTKLQEHVAWTLESTTPYNYCEWRNNKLTKTGENTSNLASKIQLEAWDYVLIQTDHLNSGKISSYEPYLTQMIDFVKTNCSNKNVKIGLYMTWAYDKTSTADGFDYYKNSDVVMYDSIISCVNRIMPNHPELFLIPCGTAIQNARNSYKGQTLNRDGYHLDYAYGRYIASLCWVKALCGVDPEDVSYKPEDISDYCANMCRAAVDSAFAKPMAVSSLMDNFGTPEEENQPADESRLQRVTFNGVSMPLVEGVYDYTIKVKASAAAGEKVSMYSFPISTKAEQNIITPTGADVPRDITNYGYFPLTAPALGEEIIYTNRVIAQDKVHVTTYTIHLIGVETSNLTCYISSRADLEDFAAAVNGGLYDLDAVVTRDINLGMSKSDWWTTPIGTVDHPYTGTFDGKGHTLSGFNICSNGDTAMWQIKALGLFGAIQNATIKNLNLIAMEECFFTDNDNVSVNTSAGVLVGQMQNSTISRCKVSADVFANAKDFPCGAICGLENGGDSKSYITECSASGAWRVRQAWYYAGFVGKANNITISNSSSFVTMQIQKDFSTHMAGFVGLSQSSESGRMVTLENCYYAGQLLDTRAANGNTTEKTLYLGALISYAKEANTTMTNCYYLEGSATKAVSTTKNISTVPTAESFPTADLTNGNLVAKLNGSFVQGRDYPVVAGEEITDPEQRGYFNMTKTHAELAAQYNWTAGTNAAAAATSRTFKIGNVTITSDQTNGNGCWRKSAAWTIYYSYNNGPLTITADEGYWIDHVKYTYTESANAILVNDPTKHERVWNSNDTINVKGTTRTWKTGNTSGETEGFLGFTQFNIVYYQLPTSIVMADSMSVAVGSSLQIGEVTPATAYHVWSSDNTDAVTVDQNGLITAVGAGKATITVTSKNNITKSCVVTVAANAGESFTENFNAYGITTAYSNDVVTKSKLTNGISWSLRNIKRDATTMIESQQGVALQYRVGETKNKDKNYIAYQGVTEEGGVKAVSFKWRAIDADKDVLFDVDDANGYLTKYHEVLPASALNQEVHTFAREMNYAQNNFFRIRLASVNSSNVVFGPLTITPYLLYTKKVVNLDAQDLVEDNFKYTNEALINNVPEAEEENISYAFKYGNVADIDGETGELTIKGAGKDTVVATWGNVSTSYEVNVTLANPGLNFAIQEAEALLNTGSYTQKAQTSEQTTGAISYYVSAKPEGATAHVTDEGVVTFDAVGEYTIQASVAQALPYMADTATYSLKVTSLPVPTIVVKDTAVTMNSGKFTNPLQAPEGIGDKHYSSTNINVATVAASTGEVTIVGEGTTTITLQIGQGSSYAATETSYILTVNDPGETKLKENFVPQGNWGTSATEINGRLFKWNTNNTRRNVSKEKLANGDSAVWFGSTGYSWIESQDVIEGGIKRVSFYFNKYDNNTVNLKLVLAVDGVVVDSACQDNVAGTTRAANDFWFNHNLSVQKNAKLRISAPTADVTTHLGYVNITPYLLYTEKNVKALAQSGPYTNTALINNTGTKPSYSISCQSDTATIDEDGAVTIYKTATATVTASWGEVSTSYTINMSAKSLPTVTLDNTTIEAFDSYNPAPVAKIGDDTIQGAQWTYASNNPAVATVNEGVFTITGVGTTTITATLVEGEEYVPASAEATLTVTEPTVGVWKETYDSLATKSEWDGKKEWVGRNSVLNWQARHFKYNGDKVNDENAIRLGYTADENNFIATNVSYEGGMKSVFFNWRMPGSGEQTANFTVDYSESSASYSKAVKNNVTAGNNYYSFVDDLNCKADGRFRIRMNKNADAAIFGPMTIKPYLLYRCKDTVVWAKDYVGTAIKVINTDTIDNTEGEGTITYAIEDAASKASVATIDAETGAVSILGGGTVKVIAMWKHDPVNAPNDSVTTFYTLRINRTSIDPTALSFEEAGPVSKSMYDEPFSNTLSGVPESGAGAITYTSSKPGVATVDNNGLVTIKGAGTTTITANVAVSAVYTAASKSYTLNVAEPQGEGRMDEAFSGKLWSVDDKAVEGDLGTWNTFRSRRKDTDKMQQGEPAIFFLGDTSAYIQSQDKLEGGIKRMSFVWYRSPLAEDPHPQDSIHNFSIMMDGQVMDTIDAAIEGWKQYNYYSHTFGVMKNVKLKLENTSLGATKIDTIRIVPYICYTTKQIDTMFTEVKAPFANEDFINNTNSQGVLRFTSSNEAVATVDGNGVVTALQSSEAAVTITAIWKPSADAIDSVTTCYQVMLHGKVARNAYFANPAKSVDRGTVIASDLQYDTQEGDVPATPNVTYASSNPAVAVVNGNQIEAVGAGTAVITAKIDATSLFRADSASYDLTVTYTPEAGKYWTETFSKITTKTTSQDTLNVTGDDGVQKKWQRYNCYYTDTILNKDTKGLRLRYNGYIASQQALDGGIKELMFDWRVFNNSNYTEHFFITVGDSTIDYSYGTLESKNTTIPFAHSFNMKQNVVLKIQNDNAATLAHPIISPIKIVPYLYYTMKSKVIKAGESFKNDSLIDNRDDAEPIQYSFVEDNVTFAQIDAMGNVTTTASGVVNVKAQWGNVYTTYKLTILDDETLITLMRNDSTEGYDEITNKLNQPMPTIAQPTREGYRFNAYFTAEEGGTRYTVTDLYGTTKWVAKRVIGGDSIVDYQRNWVYPGSYFTLYAQWKPELTIVLDNQDTIASGTEWVKTAKCEYNNTVNLSKNITVPTKLGATFRGYYTEPKGKGTKLVDESGAFIANVAGYTNEYKMWQKSEGDTLYAKWIHRITYASGGAHHMREDGTLPVDSTEYITGDVVTLASADSLYNPGHSWQGWRVSYTIDSTEYEIPVQNGKFTMPDFDVTATGTWALIDTTNIKVGAPTSAEGIEDNSNVSIISGGDMQMDAAKTLDTVYVGVGGKISADETLTVTDLVIRATASATGTSGQIDDASNTNIVITGNAYFDLTLAKGGTNKQWHAFTVPFPVDMMNGIFDLDGNKLTSEKNYSIMVYQGDVRAKGQYGWIKVQKTGNTILKPGTFYIMATDGYRTTYRMKMYGTFQTQNEELEIKQYPYDEQEATIQDAGWNGIGNSQLNNRSVNINVQVLDPVSYSFRPILANEAEFAVGTPFFYQAGNDTTIILDPEAAAAPARMRAFASEPKEIAITLANEDYTDYLYISATADATNNYQIGRDLARMSMTSTPAVPLIVAKAYNTKLCMVDAPMVNDEATYALSLYAPETGEYTLAAAQVAGYEIFLTQNGEVIWNLSMSDYSAQLNKGDNTTYSLVLRKLPATPTELMQNAQCTMQGVQKFIYDERLVIIRDNKVYNGAGALMK